VRSDPIRSRRAKVIRGAIRFLMLLLLLMASCGKLLGLRDSQVQGACTTDAECAPGYGCLQQLGCHNKCSKDDDCGPGSRCFKAFVTTACIPASEGCGQPDVDSGAPDACPEGSRCDGTVCRNQCTTADDCLGGQMCVKGACVSDSIHEKTGGSGGSGGSGGNAGAGNAAGKHAGGASNGGENTGGASSGGASSGGASSGGENTGGASSGGASNGGENTGGGNTGGASKGGATSMAGTSAGGASNGGAGKGGGGNGGGGNGGGGKGGATSMGGAPAGGAPAGGGPAGGAPAGGAGAGAAGAGGSGGTGGGAATTQPSSGCSAKTPRPAGGQVQVANTSLYMFPASYDGTKPFPLLIALHACGNPNSQFVNLTNNTGFATDYVRSFPNTPDSGQCWTNYAADIARITAQYDELMSKYCIDKSRVFAIAHNSGAQLLVNILAHQTDAQYLNLKGISPVAGDPYNVAVPTPVLYIAGVMDTQRVADSAKNTVAKFRAANSCASTSKPYTAVMSCSSIDAGQPLVDPGCIAYDSCSVPTIWCAHNDPSYSGTQHGVPCFGITSMYNFFRSL